jgi:hypothetical protein
MICPHIVNWSMLVGALLSWGFMWPLMARKEGDWYPAGLDSHDFRGLFGYKVGSRFIWSGESVCVQPIRMVWQQNKRPDKNPRACLATS